jgi:hypothetical protein
VLRGKFISVFDLIELARAENAKFPQNLAWTFLLRTFGSSKELFKYSKAEGKIYPKWIGKANSLFQDVLNRFL